MSYKRALDLNRMSPSGYSDQSSRDRAGDQLRLEFAVFYELVNEFNGSFDRPGTALGLESVHARDGYLVLIPAPEYSRRVVSRLLPSYDRESGNHYGVAGLRARPRGAEWELRVHNTDAKLHIPAVRFPADLVKGWNPVPDKFDLIWNSHEHLLTEEEIFRWFSPFRDGAPTQSLARSLLRRPNVIQRLNARGTCWVDIYHHAYMDVMLEWCCGPSKATVSEWLRAESDIGPWLNFPPTTSDRDAHPLKLMRHECGEARSQWKAENAYEGHILSLVRDYREEFA
ncbi:hypothetical protein [Nocardia sp. NPDC049149]|uniref:hypothetical protein n=1 Tax=Nocardia sp. NPDC049149 TaxID=3364315 RepID=UPI003712DA3D